MADKENTEEETDEESELGTIDNPFSKWDDIWAEARELEATHFNYSRGKVRFRAALENPMEIGEEPVIQGNVLLRVRFFTETDDAWDYEADNDVFLQIGDEIAMALPAEFEGWSPAKQHEHVNASLAKLGAQRLTQQWNDAQRVLWGYIAMLQTLIARKDKEIAELRSKVEKLLSSQGVENIYSFLLHDNAPRALESVAVLVERVRGLPPEQMREALKTAAAEAKRTDKR